MTDPEQWMEFVRERHAWLRRYHQALDEGYSMSEAIHKANQDKEQPAE